MKGLRMAVLAAGVAMLGACSGFHDFDEVEALNAVSPVGSPFTQRLTAEYRNMTNKEIDLHDHADGLHFSRKGLAAARGDVVMPEPLSDWNLARGHMDELASARGRLINAYDLGARELMPDLSAVAQARFDCWIEEQEENWDSPVTICKNEFWDALNQIEAGLPAQVAPPAPVVEPVAEPFDVDPNQPMEAENAMYLVFFDFDKSNIGPGANSVLDAVAEEVGRRSLNVINVVGHADTSGPKAYNRRLAMRRANAIRDALVSRGIDPNIIRVESRGEEDLLVQTADNVREPANRRGEITFE